MFLGRFGKPGRSNHSRKGATYSPPRRRKLHIPHPAASGRSRSFRCSSSPHKAAALRGPLSAVVSLPLVGLVALISALRASLRSVALRIASLRLGVTKAPPGLSPRGQPCRVRHRRAVGCAACGHPTASFRHGTILPAAHAPHRVASSLLRQRSKTLSAAAGTKEG